MKAVILARVSTKEQEEGHSINAQLQRLQDYCIRRGMVVLETFHIVESSTKGERREFQRLLEFAKSQPETIAIVADAVDRVQRSFKESVYLDELIGQEKIELHFYREGMVIGKNASPSDIMRWDFSVMGAKSYVLQLSENVRRSMEWKIKNGECIGLAPIGYLNAKDQITGKSTVIVDPVAGPIVERIFAEYATGNFTLGDMLEKSKEWGLRTKHGKILCRSKIHALIQNPFYYGEMKIKGAIYPHQYERIITREVFTLCQQVREGWHKKPFKHSEKEFVFRGLLKCAVTGQTVWGDQKTKKYSNGGTGQWTYLVAADPLRPGKKVYIREEAVIEQMKGVFSGLRIPADVMEGIREHLRNSHAAEQRFHRESIGQLQGQLTKINERMHRLADFMLDGLFTPEEAKAKRQELLRQRDDIAAKLLQHQKGDDGFLSSMEAALFLTSRAYDLFVGSSIEEKRIIIGLIFSNLQLNGKNLRYSVRFPFSEFTKPATGGEWRDLLDTIRTCPELRMMIIQLPVVRRGAFGNAQSFA